MIEIKEKKENLLEIVVKGYPLAFINSIRRASLSEVPVMAVDEVYMVENNSPLFDEILAHRLAMIPFKSEGALDKYRKPEECAECKENCEGCFTKIYLDVEATNSIVVVNSSMIKSEDPEVVPVSQNIPITVLGRGQKVSLEAKLRLGRGKEHAKWSAASIATHRYYPSVKIVNPESKCLEIAMKVCPSNVFGLVNGKIEVLNEYACILCEECLKVCGKDVTINYEKDKLILRVESNGSMTPKRILMEAAKIIRSKVQQLEEWLNKTEEGQVEESGNN